MRKNSLFMIALFGIASMWVGCSDSQKITGTSEEENEVIAREESSSSAGPETISSSSSKKVESSSSKDVASMSSSSSEVHFSTDSQNFSSSVEIASSSSELASSSSSSELASSSSSSVESSSSSAESSSSSEPPIFDNSSSSSRPGAAEGTNPNTFGYYISAFALDSAAFDSTVMASAIVYVEPPSASLPTSSSSTTPKEFKVPGLHQFTKDNIDTLKLKFPTAVRKYKDLVTAIENGSAECNLYLYNVQGDVRTVGHVVANITADTITVLDIVSDKCSPTAEETFGFLFTYCGEMSAEPELVRIAVESDIPANKCPNGRVSEWIKEN